MATPHANTGVPLPHAGLFSYFRNPEAPPNSSSPKKRSPPSYNECAEAHQSLGTGVYRVNAEDGEESNVGFWGERVPSHDTELKSPGFRRFFDGRCNQNKWYAFCCFWCAVSICIMAAFGIFFVIDLGFSQYGMGTGMAKWMIHEHVRRSTTQYEMRFCLATPNREVPGQQRWRYLQPKTYGDCTTEIVTLFASPSEQWKITPDAEILLGRVTHPDNRDEEYQKYSSMEEHIGSQELNDDIAEEEKLWQ